MDYLQKGNNYINVPSSQTLIFYAHERWVWNVLEERGSSIWKTLLRDFPKSEKKKISKTLVIIVRIPAEILLARRRWTISIGRQNTNIQSVSGGKVSILGGHSIGRSKQKLYTYMCTIPNSFRDRVISLYSSKILGEKEILRTVSNASIYCSSDKVGTVYLV
jgi:hypothetical protein